MTLIWAGGAGDRASEIRNRGSICTAIPRLDIPQPEIWHVGLSDQVSIAAPRVAQRHRAERLAREQNTVTGQAGLTARRGLDLHAWHVEQRQVVFTFSRDGRDVSQARGNRALPLRIRTNHRHRAVLAQGNPMKCRTVHRHDVAQARIAVSNEHPPIIAQGPDRVILGANRHDVAERQRESAGKSPHQHRSVTPQPDTERAASRDVHDIGCLPRHYGCPPEIFSPCENTAIRAQGHDMDVAGRNFD